VNSGDPEALASPLDVDASGREHTVADKDNFSEPISITRCRRRAR
jgi:hypothetical protein